MCGSVSSLFYVRKLYKDMFASLAPELEEARTSRAATYIYYLSRPLFACLASALMVLIMYGFIRAVSVGNVGANPDFLIFVTASSALIASVTGTTVAKIQTMAEHTFLRPPV